MRVPTKQHTLARTAPVALLKVEEAQQMLAACMRVDEAKSIRDKAEAIRIYLRQQNASRDSQNDAGEIKLRAERRLGELLAEQKKAGERQGTGGDRKSMSHRATMIAAPARPAQPPVPTLADIGITRSQSSRWQDLAKVSAGRCLTT